MVFVAILLVIIMLEIVINTLKRQFMPNIIETWQELEQDARVRTRLEDLRNEHAVPHMTNG